MQKGNWNKKRVYSIRKFSVGACSVLIGTCALLLGASLSQASSVYANENTEEIVSTNRIEHQPEN
ncbi:MAG: YSIRK-type signal peptide-containing protein, partial [Streptococcus mitis]|nr:YSIRK-type signal peptide-containing protein [Streptococcus mitis]